MSKPNFLFILIDDMGWRDISCYGSVYYETPVIDRLANEGIRFTNAYATCPVCSPTRASILTGKYPATVGVTNWIGDQGKGKLIPAPYTHHLPLSEISLAKTLKGAGYRTYHVGKWHLGDKQYCPENHGFDVNIGGSHWGSPRNGYFSPYKMQKLPDGPAGEYLTDRLTAEAIKLIENNGNDPFFLYLAHYAVHTPIQVAAPYLEKYRGKALSMGLDREKTFEDGEFFPVEHKKTERVCRRLLQSDPGYAGMVQNLDENMGRLLDALKRTGKFDNTVVVFTSDNGGLATSEGSPTCNAPLAEGKGWMYEGGTREPLIIRLPGRIAAATVCDTPVISTDFYPTFLELAGLPLMPQQHCDGESLVPLLAGKGTIARDAIFWHYPHYGNQGGTPGSSIRCGDYKLIEFFEDGRRELYNLRDDVGEDHNLALDEPARTHDLGQRLAEWRERVEAKIPLANPDYKPW